jgi:uncharacterized membrane protein
METIKLFVEWSATAIEVGTVLLLVIATTFGTVIFLFRLGRRGESAYHQFKVRLGKMLILALEFMVTADIIRTVALDQTLHNVLILGLLVMIRTFLSWSLSVEIEGRWPWKGGTEPELEVTGK